MADNNPVHIAIRFSASIPDLHLTLPSTIHLATTPNIALKQLIRPHLAEEFSTSRLTLIHGGKILRPNDALSNLPFSQAQSSSKGKEPQTHALYINCSIGSTISETDLSKERAAIIVAEKALLCIPSVPSDDRTSKTVSGPDIIIPISLGFDRLLTQGWTPNDILDLRITFNAYLSHTRPQSSIPSGQDLRALEDEWLDSTVGGPGAEFASEEGSFDDEAAAIDDRLWGLMTGFFFPPFLGLDNPTGDMWSERRKNAVIAGVAINLMFGILRAMSGRWDGI